MVTAVLHIILCDVITASFHIVMQQPWTCSDICRNIMLHFFFIHSFRHHRVGSESPRRRISVRKWRCIEFQPRQRHRHDMPSTPVGDGRFQVAFQRDCPHGLVSTELLLQVNVRLGLPYLWRRWFAKLSDKCLSIWMGFKDWKWCCVESISYFFKLPEA